MARSLEYLAWVRAGSFRTRPRRIDRRARCRRDLTVEAANATAAFLRARRLNHIAQVFQGISGEIGCIRYKICGVFETLASEQEQENTKQMKF